LRESTSLRLDWESRSRDSASRGNRLVSRRVPEANRSCGRRGCGRAGGVRAPGARSGSTPKQTAITQLGAGINAKLNVQLSSRIWNADASTGSLYTGLPFQSGWDVTRGQPGATGVLVEYPGASVAKSLG
jgi:hypothetical protein